MSDDDGGTYWRGPKVKVVKPGKYVTPTDPDWDYEEYERALANGACSPLPPTHVNHSRRRT